jgi:hypothetical protein
VIVVEQQPPQVLQTTSAREARETKHFLPASLASSMQDAFLLLLFRFFFPFFVLDTFFIIFFISLDIPVIIAIIIIIFI